MKPLAIDLYCGLGGWAEGLLAEGWNVIGFDIEEHVYGAHRYPGQLLIRDVTTLHGSWFKDASLIVASPPCQEYSYMAMPWKLAKAKAAAIRADVSGVEMARLTRLFRECYRIQREACEASGRYIPLIIENVRGAQPWVGKAAGKYGSFYLWGDVPALMPVTSKAIKVPTMGAGWYPPGHPKHTPGLGFNTHAARNLRDGMKVPGFRFDGSGKTFQTAAVDGQKQMNIRLNYRDLKEGIKQGGDWFNASQPSMSRLYGSKSPQRKMASAMIAKIPLPLSRHIAAHFKTPPSAT